MPSIRDHAAVIDKLIDDAGNYAAEGASQITKFDETMMELKVAVAMLGAMALTVTTRYDYWRQMYAEKAGMSESDFDTMTDECIKHATQPGDDCLHLIVTAGGYCANCGVKR